MIESLELMRKNKHDPDFVIDKTQLSRLIALGHKIDVYMMGLTMLELCTYSDSESLFNQNTLKFNEIAIE